MAGISAIDFNWERYRENMPGLFGDPSNSVDYQGKKIFYPAKQGLSVTSHFLKMPFGELVSCVRHIPAQILPAVGWAFSCTGTFTGLINTMEGLVNTSDFIDFLNDFNFWLNGDATEAFSKHLWIDLSAYFCGTIANVTNTIDLLRIWGMASFAYLGDFATTIGNISIGAVKPFAFVAGWTVSGVCTTALVVCYAVLTYKSQVEYNQGLKDIEKYKNMTDENLKQAYDDYRIEKLKKIKNEDRIAKKKLKYSGIPMDLVKFKEKKVKALTKSIEIDRLSWWSNLSKGSLYFTLFGAGVSQMPILGALGLAATLTTSRVWYFKHYG